ncbi:PKD domain-containing protein [Parafrankia sp. EUN1f]|uniref:PKD domain-containing protein n=1 Tax=Parafrankia sp. EUN1f TaxID=102897 RepID=UPI0001C46BC1|nr:PKD domain-containing protein [Parafrankia sp. EUN1f]EFC82190.1 PKD domain containing protein [Parafrankia sp. EUN1f]
MRLAVTCAILVAAAVAVVVVSSRDDPALRVSLDSGSAWLVSSAVGQAALVDGSSGQLITQVRVADPGSDLSAASTSAQTLVADTATGTVVRVDSASYEVSRPVRFARPGQRLRVFPGPRRAYVFAEQAGLVTSVDSRTLSAGQPQSVVSRIGPGGGVVDATGRLWLVDADSGRIVSLDSTGTGPAVPRTGAVASPAARLLEVGGRAVVVDGDAVRPLHDDGTFGAPTCLAGGARDDTAVLTGSAAASRVYAASGQRGVLLVSDLDRNRCDTAIDLDAAGHTLGEPAEAAGRVFIPDFTTGEVHIADLAHPGTVTHADILDPDTPFDLVPSGPFVFYNDPASARAGVLSLTGQTIPIQKYNPDRPGDDLFSGGSGGGAEDTQGSGGSGGSGDSSKPTTPPTGTASPRPPTPTGTGSRTPDRDRPAVQIQMSMNPAAAGRPVVLRALASGGSKLASVRWSFGDDTGTAAGVEVSHTWARPGSYPVTIRAALASGEQAQVASTINVTDQEPPTRPDPSRTPPPSTHTQPPPGPNPNPNPGPTRTQTQTDQPVNPATPTLTVAQTSPTSLNVTVRPGTGAGAAVTRFALDASPAAGTTVNARGGGAFQVDVTGCDAFTLVGTVSAATGATARSQPHQVAARTDGDCSLPTLSLSVTPTSGQAPLTVTAEDEIRYVMDPHQSYRISFGDGSAEIAGSGATHTYTAPGTYTVTLTAIKDGTGVTATDTATVTVGAPFKATAGRASVSPGSGTYACPLTLTFTGTVTANGAGTATWAWRNHGPGAQSLTFGGAGTQTVSFTTTVDGAPGETVTSTDEIEIYENGQITFVSPAYRASATITCASPATPSTTSGAIGGGSSGG